MSNTTPCLNPARCGVTNHQVGSEAHKNCVAANLSTQKNDEESGTKAALLTPSLSKDEPLLDAEAIERINSGDLEDEDFDNMLTLLQQQIKDSPEGFRLVYWNPGDQLEQEQVSKYLNGYTEEIVSEAYDGLSTSGYMFETLQNRASDYLGNLGIDFDSLDLDYKTEIYDLLEDSDTGDWAEELAANTPNQLMRYALTPNMSKALSEEAIGTATSIPDEQFEKVVDARVREIGDLLVDQGHLPEISESTKNKLRELFSDSWYLGDGDNLDVLWYGDIREVGGDKVTEGGTVVTSQGPVTLLLSNTSGRFSEMTLDEPISLKLDYEHNARLDEAEDPKGFGSLSKSSGGVHGPHFAASFSAA